MPPLAQPVSASSSNVAPSPWWHSSVLLASILFCGTLLLYSPAFNDAFVNYDDPAYVTSNAHVLEGLSLQNVRWAMAATVEANWHPLTWISHMADVQLFGTNPRGHHAVSVVIHGLNVVLIFLLLHRATGFFFRSAMVAALFSAHPLNVECVAWVAERKSLLSMLFLLLALLGYCHYVRRPNWQRYVIVVICFALGLAAKPMIVSFPLLLLIWDFWPLDRLRFGGAPETLKLRLIVLEKVPLALLSAASCWITIYAQHSAGALGSTWSLPWHVRFENAVYSYAVYLGKAIWPSGLAVFYPHPEVTLAIWKVVAAGVLIVALTALAWCYRARRPFALAGWLWYGIAMLPMIGIVQVGRQAMADRYAYLPFLGLFLVVVWLGAELFGRLRLSVPATAMLAAAVVLAYAAAAFVQMSYWRNSFTLFSHALAVTSRNGIAEANLGAALMEMGRPDVAMPHFEAAARYIPQLSTAHYNLGVLAQQSGRAETARFEYELALQYSTDPTEISQAQSNLGFLLLDADPRSAADRFSAALRINPDKTNALLGRGMAEYQLGDLDAAVSDLMLASRSPMPLAYYWLGRTLERKGQSQGAINAYQIALHLAPTVADAQQRLDGLTHSSLH